MTARRLVLLAVSAASGMGCAALLGVTEYQAVDCTDDCEEGDGASDASAEADAGYRRGAPATEVLEASTDASTCTSIPGCTEGSRIVVSVLRSASSQTIASAPPGISVEQGETASGCFVDGVSLHLKLSAGNADFTGVKCEGTNLGTDTCEFPVDGSVCVVASLNGN